MVAEAQPHVAATAALLRAAIGAGPGQGARGAIAARQSALDASQGRLLAAVRSDSRVGPTARYNLFRSITEARDDDPDESAFDALLALLGAMEEAHAALGAGGADADAKVSPSNTRCCGSRSTTKRAGGAEVAPGSTRLGRGRHAARTCRWPAARSSSSAGPGAGSR